MSDARELLEQMRHFADLTNRFDRDTFADDTAYADWVQSRARAYLTDAPAPLPADAPHSYSSGPQPNDYVPIVDSGIAAIAEAAAAPARDALVDAAINLLPGAYFEQAFRRDIYRAGYAAALAQRDVPRADPVGDVETVTAADAERHGLLDPQSGVIRYLNPMFQVVFRAGLLACREYMARFVAAESPTIANSIRANWWPSLGDDPGPPRKNRFDEWYEGEPPDGHMKDPSPSIEALPYALQFLQQHALGYEDAAPQDAQRDDARDHLREAERTLGRLAMDIMQERRDELLEWARSVKVTFPDGSPHVELRPMQEKR